MIAPKSEITKDTGSKRKKLKRFMLDVRVPPQFEITKDAAGKYRFRLRAPNGEIIAVSEAYGSKSGCKSGIASVKKNARKAIIQDLTEE